ncbi:hypothetical protein NEISICOT_00373 [Neisseria sicca ATCC 29256]|uniref:Uncharacterized protein n=1 Tax=Neisseria sicca ATCC 29256 TaxID=547045 RepID=C6M1J0_NEISI|nr:hypothetical protein NEISICOT_00373 [Neisseria sicca ATCC 29256]
MGFAHKNGEPHTVRHHFCKRHPWAKPALRFCTKSTLLSDDLSHKLGRLKPANQPYCPFGYR